MKKVLVLITLFLTAAALSSVAMAANFKIVNNTGDPLFVFNDSGNLNVTTGWIAERGVLLSDLYCSLYGCAMTADFNVSTINIAGVLNVTTPQYVPINTNMSLYWNNFGAQGDLVDTHTHSCANITGATSDLCTITATIYSAGNLISLDGGAISVDGATLNNTIRYWDEQTNETLMIENVNLTLFNTEAANNASQAVAINTALTNNATLWGLMAVYANASTEAANNATQAVIISGEIGLQAANNATQALEIDALRSLQAANNATQAVLITNRVAKAGDTMTGDLIMSNAGIDLQGGNITSTTGDVVIVI